MAADPKDPRTKRRVKAGDDPNRKAQSGNNMPGAPGGMPPPQPMPGAPQGRGNVMNNPVIDVGNQMGQRIGDNVMNAPYGDMKLPNNGANGAVGPLANSGRPQNVVQGQGQNAQGPYGIPQLGAPNNQMAGQMEVMYNGQQAMKRAFQIAPQNPQPSYSISPGGMIAGMPPQAYAQGAVPQAISPMQTSQSAHSLGLQGMADAQGVQQMGMGMNRGGGKGPSPKQKKSGKK